MEECFLASEQRTGLQFEAFQIDVVVVEAPLPLDSALHSMRLRASYLTNTPKATLIHELRHRVQGRLLRNGDEDHLYLFLYLYDVWVTPY